MRITIVNVSRSEFVPRRIEAGTLILGAGPARKYLSRRGRSYVATLIRSPAQLELTPRKTLSLAVLITPPNVACVRACLPRVYE